jgi:hypothetical protein
VLTVAFEKQFAIRFISTILAVKLLILTFETISIYIW